MKSASSALTAFSPRRTILFGTLAVGITDILWAIVMNAMNGKGPVWVLQSVAGGVYGTATFQGGLRTALTGMFLHFFIAGCWFTAYYIASRRFPDLARRPFLWGPIYGVLAYLVMYQVVLPLSAYHTSGIHVGPGMYKQLFIHIFGVGLLAALIVRRGSPTPQGA